MCTVDNRIAAARPRLCITSGGDEIRFRSYVNHAIYAREHGHDYRLECGVDVGVTNKFFYKTAIVRRVLALNEWMCWIDDDAFFTDFSSDGLALLIDRAENEGAFLVIAEGPREPNGFWSRINTGAFLLKNSEKAWQLLDVMQGSTLAEVEAWWDPGRDGLYTGGDQDQMWWALSTTELIKSVMIVGHRELNSRGHYYENSLQDAFVMHFAGHRDKPLGIARFAERFSVGHELVPEHLLDKYSVKVRSPMGRAERHARAARQYAIGRAKPYLKPVVVRYRDLRARRALR